MKVQIDRSGRGMVCLSKFKDTAVIERRQTLPLQSTLGSIGVTYMWQGRPSWAEIDLDAVEHNTRTLKQQIGKSTELLAMVKANAYGHGAVAVSKTVLNSGASRLGVACVDEGIQLRESGITAPILILGYTPVWEAERCLEHKITPTVNDKRFALALATLSAEKGIITPIHLKVDTGLSRFGLPPAELIDFARFVRTLPGLFIEGLYTHFATADEADKSFTLQQYEVFRTVVAQLPDVPCLHVSNSAATIDLPDLHLGMVRTGIGIYGLYPSPEVDHSIDLRPVLSLKSRVARLRTLSPGESVGYGRTWVAERPTRIALVPTGYGDGFPRLLSNKGCILVHGIRTPILGRISMDHTVIDVSDVHDVTQDEEVVLIGTQGRETITAEEVASLAGTINYEIICGISPRVPRVYMRHGEVIAADVPLIGQTAF